jgi:hypothetical protein
MTNRDKRNADLVGLAGFSGHPETKRASGVAGSFFFSGEGGINIKHLTYY